MQYQDIKRNMRAHKNMGYVQFVVFIIFCISILFVPLVRFTWVEEETYGIIYNSTRKIEYYSEFSAFQNEAPVNIVDEDHKFDLGFEINEVEKLMGKRSLENFQVIEDEEFKTEKISSIGNWLFYGFLGVMFVASIVVFYININGNGTAKKSKFRPDVKDLSELSRNDFNVFLVNEFKLNAGIGFLFFGMIVFTVPLLFIWPFQEKVNIILREGVEHSITPAYAVFLAAYFVIMLITKIIQGVFEKNVANGIRENNILSLDMLNGKVPSANNQAQTTETQASAPANKPSDKASAIREYKQLLDEGAITQEEYDKLKNNILTKE